MNNILDWLEFGTISAERDDNLSKYYFDNNVLGDVISSKSSFLILGRKGAGKTAVFKYLNENHDQFLGEKDVLVPLSLEDYNWNIHNLLDNPEKISSLAYKQSWKLVLLVETIKGLYEKMQGNSEKIPLGVKRSIKVLEKLFSTPVPSVYELIGRKLLSLASMKLPGVEVDLEQGLDSIDLSAGELSFKEFKDNKTLKEQLSANVEHLIYFLDKQLKSIKSEYRVFICFDRVDESWDESSYLTSKLVIAGLVSASDSITTNFNGQIRPLLFLREDIFDSLNLNDSNKLRLDCGRLLHWDKTSLESLVLKRVNFYAEIQKINLISSLNHLLPVKEMRHRSRPLNYILKRTMMRPRDIIAYFSFILRAMKEKTQNSFDEEITGFERLESEFIYGAEASYSEWLEKEILEEWRIQFSAIEDLFFTIKEIESVTFSHGTFADEVRNVRGLKFNPNETIHYLKFLFENSVIGLKIGNSTEWKFKCFYPSQGFIECEDYRVHEGLIRAFGLKENGHILGKK